MHGVFDIVGPVMIGPSSSHTAGAVRLGLMARKILGEPAVRAEINLHGSFAQTYRGHGTDKALIAGILGFAPDDERIREALRLAEEQGLSYRFQKVSLEQAHPNTAVIHLTGASGRTARVRGSSVGGGNIRITNIDGYEVELTARTQRSSRSTTTGPASSRRSRRSSRATRSTSPSCASRATAAARWP